jgi:hypothetical protein
MSDQTDPLIAPATPPAVSDRFEIHGISLSEALDDPVLGPALEDFHDRLCWSKDDPPELGAEGIEQFRPDRRRGPPMRSFSEAAE